MTPKEKALDMVANQAARFWEFAHELNIKPTPPATIAPKNN